MNKTFFDGNAIHFNSTDISGMISLMERADEFAVPWCGKNSDGEHIMISVNKNNITVETCQNNGWLRENIYWKDGTTEELYHR